MKCNSKQKCAASEPTNLRTKYTLLYTNMRFGMIMVLYRLSCVLASSKYTFTADKFEGHIEYLPTKTK